MAQGVLGRLRPRIFLTFQHYKCGRSTAKFTGRFYPRRNPWYSVSEAESTPGNMVLSGVPRKKSPVTTPGIDPGTVRLVAQRNKVYTYKQFHDTSRRMTDAAFVACVSINACTLSRYGLRSISLGTARRIVLAL